jgi:hypothetical protein
MPPVLYQTTRKKNSSIIIGADINAAISTKKIITQPNPEELCHDKIYDDPLHDPIDDLLGNFRNPRRNQSGERILNLLREHNLQATSTFFDKNNKYNTWICPSNATTNKRTAHLLDHFFTPRNQLHSIIGVKRKFNGPTSDHAAIQITLKLPSGIAKRKATPIKKQMR